MQKRKATGALLALCLALAVGAPAEDMTPPDWASAGDFSIDSPQAMPPETSALPLPDSLPLPMVGADLPPLAQDEDQPRMSDAARHADDPHTVCFYWPAEPEPVLLETWELAAGTPLFFPVLAEDAFAGPVAYWHLLGGDPSQQVAEGTPVYGDMHLVAGFDPAQQAETSGIFVDIFLYTQGDVAPGDTVVLGSHLGGMGAEGVAAYQWQCREPDGSWVDLAGANDSTYAFVAGAQSMAREYRLRVTPLAQR